VNIGALLADDELVVAARLGSGPLVADGDSNLFVHRFAP
jgi:hypothetical protein